MLSLTLHLIHDICQNTMNRRLSTIFQLSQQAVRQECVRPSHRRFKEHVFDKQQIAKYLPAKKAANWLAAMDGSAVINPDYLVDFAKALKKWALHHQATHFSHWFQPLTGFGAEKYDSFCDWAKTGHSLIDQFNATQLMRGETDASSFPTGGLRRTHASLGVTIWDPTISPFLWEENGLIILLIPALFISHNGEALDQKIPLLRSEQKMNAAAKRLLKLAKIPEDDVIVTLGPEQEYFLVDRGLFDLRPDLSLCGRTVLGSRSSKGQELEDHYNSAILPRILSFMKDFEEAALKLGIPVLTHHNEVAPAQHETALLFERASLASDHNLLLMRIMHEVASEHQLACLFHEKPFAHLNGSGKHCNWSLATISGMNLLDPNQDRFIFLVLLTAILRAVHEHSLLLRASIGTYQNDWRIGACEAPPAIVSVFLGDALQEIVESIIHDRKPVSHFKKNIELGLSMHFPISNIADDRNRTAFLAFNRNRFELRAVGASQNIAWPICVLNAIVTDSLVLILDEIEDAIDRNRSKDLFEISLPVLKKHLKIAEPITYSGDNYSLEWQHIAETRSLPNVSKSVHAFSVFREPKTERVFQKILTKDELTARLEIFYDQYSMNANIEANVMIELFRTQILPAAIQQQQIWAQAVLQLKELKIPDQKQQDHLERFVEQMELAICAIDDLETIQKQTINLSGEAKGKVFCELLLPKLEKSREIIDQLENQMDDFLWPLAKYRELLFKL